jgi:transcriptional regulator with XRE-family HTH domain
MSVSFGDLVRRGREEAGLSQSRLAHLIGKSPTTIRAWEHGRTNPADPQAVAALAAVLGLDETELLDRAGFEAPVARTRPSARQELTSLATERTEMIGLAPLPEAPEVAKPVKVTISKPDVVDIPMENEPVKIEVVTAPAAEVAVDLKPATTAPEPLPVPPAVVPKPKFGIPKPKLPAHSARALGTRPDPSSRGAGTRAPRTRVVVTQQMTQTAPSSPNGFVAGHSYIEDEGEKDFYRRRAVTTAIVMVFLVIVIWWALGRTGGAIGDFIEGIVGLLDI